MLWKGPVATLPLQSHENSWSRQTECKGPVTKVPSQGVAASKSKCYHTAILASNHFNSIYLQLLWYLLIIEFLYTLFENLKGNCKELQTSTNSCLTNSQPLKGLRHPQNWRRRCHYPARASDCSRPHCEVARFLFTVSPTPCKRTTVNISNRSPTARTTSFNLGSKESHPPIHTARSCGSHGPMHVGSSWKVRSLQGLHPSTHQLLMIFLVIDLFIHCFTWFKSWVCGSNQHRG